MADCEGVTATWCPNHGDCTCPRRHDGEVEFNADGDCPLHMWDSDHPRPPARSL